LGDFVTIFFKKNRSIKNNYGEKYHENIDYNKLQKSLKQKRRETKKKIPCADREGEQARLGK
jgi:hypothetical protein